VSRCIVGHICVLAGGGEDGVASWWGLAITRGSGTVVGVRPPGGEIERVGVGAYRGSLRCLRHSISAVGPKIPYTKKRSLGAGPFHQPTTSITSISGFRRSSPAAASREDHHQLRSGPGSSYQQPIRGYHSPTYGSVLSSTGGQSSLAHRLADWLWEPLAACQSRGLSYSGDRNAWSLV
jgi:hypothetical protein